MEVAGKLISATRNITNNKFRIEFEVDSLQPDEVNRLALCDLLDIKANKHRQKRSLDANALLWLCLGRIATALQADKWSIYLQMLKRYGKFTYICVKPNVAEAVKMQWRESEVIGEISINGQTAVQMLCYFGSSTYNTKEFSVLLEGVISEMQEMRLETPTSEDMRRALEQWEKNNGNKANNI